LEEGDIVRSLTGTTGKEDYGFALRMPDCGHPLLMNQRIMKFDAIRRDIIDDGDLLPYLRSGPHVNFGFTDQVNHRSSWILFKTLPSAPISVDERFLSLRFLG
jgi:type I restriction enzyme S subunit